ncbi:hypothetical protein POVCU1_023350 [Plasmodium ovale curtisi]|uniref:Uncharacterized protein n=1 Tax=Plasmodium ovale curtisi TaxID=864141 RepID=A0A1A8WMH9_PLAOA|nr:hypothetical protein POVCU1_023350 [Plasmodium ovale curtisi]
MQLRSLDPNDQSTDGGSCVKSINNIYAIGKSRASKTGTWVAVCEKRYVRSGTWEAVRGKRYVGSGTLVAVRVCEIYASFLATCILVF